MSRHITAMVRGELLLTALVEAKGKQWRVLEMESLPPDQSSKFAGYDALLMVEPEDRSVRHFILPPAPQANLRRMALLQAEQRLPEIEGGYATDLLFQKAGNKIAVMAVALPLKKMEAQAARLKAARLGLAGLSVFPFYMAALVLPKGRHLLNLQLPNGPFALAIRDGLPVGWRNGLELPNEEFFCETPRDFKHEHERVTTMLCKDFGCDAAHLPFIAAVAHERRKQRLVFQEFISREERVPASVGRLMLCTAVFLIGLGLLGAASWASLWKMESQLTELRESMESRKRAAALSVTAGKELGELLRQSLELRKHSEGKFLALATIRLLSDLMPAGARISTLSFSADGQFLLDGEASDPQAPVLFVELLRRSPAMNEPFLEYLSDRGAGKINFRVTCRARENEEEKAKAVAKAKSASKSAGKKKKGEDE